jgi:hypothetical protein
MKIVVIGGFGVIGSEVAQLLQEAGHAGGATLCKREEAA